MTFDLASLDDDVLSGNIRPDTFIGGRVNFDESHADPFAGGKVRFKPHAPLPADSQSYAPADCVRDVDGLVIPALWQSQPLKWAKQPLTWRAKKSRDYLDGLQRAAITPKVVKPYASRFSTAAAIDWGKRQGWRVLAKEWHDRKTQRTHDAEFGMDVLFINTTGRAVGVQGAGRYEREPHYQRFMQRGGVDEARRLNLEIYYLEFVRGVAEPVLKERWA